MSNLQAIVDTSSRLLALPMELQKDIIDVLDIPSKLALRITSRRFLSLIKPATHQDLVSAEKSAWAIRRGLYACMDCIRLRPSRKFADAMKKGPKGLNGKEPHKRFCIDCGLHTKPYTTRYSPGAEIKVDGKRYVLCKDCRKYTAEVGGVGSGLCGGCHSRSGGQYGSMSSFMIPRSGSSARRRGSRARDYEDEWDLPEGYDEHFWECYDPAD
jgi:hypothetical protein